jgi:hypothetical protein
VPQSKLRGVSVPNSIVRKLCGLLSSNRRTADRNQKIRERKSHKKLRGMNLVAGSQLRKSSASGEPL